MSPACSSSFSRWNTRSMDSLVGSTPMVHVYPSGSLRSSLLDGLRATTLRIARRTQWGPRAAGRSATFEDAPPERTERGQVLAGRTRASQLVNRQRVLEQIATKVLSALPELMDRL